MGFQSLGWEYLLEKEEATPSRVLAWEAHGGAIVHEATKSWTRLSNGTQRGQRFSGSSDAEIAGLGSERQQRRRDTKLATMSGCLAVQ